MNVIGKGAQISRTHKVMENEMALVSLKVMSIKLRLLHTNTR